MYLFSEINRIWRSGSWRWGHAEWDVNWRCFFLYRLLCCSASPPASALMLTSCSVTKITGSGAPVLTEWLIELVRRTSALQYSCSRPVYDDAAAANYQGWLPESGMKNLTQVHYQRQLLPHLLNTKHVSQGLFSFTSSVTNRDLIPFTKAYYLCDKACFYFFHFKCLPDCLL